MSIFIPDERHWRKRLERVEDEVEVIDSDVEVIEEDTEVIEEDRYERVENTEEVLPGSLRETPWDETMYYMYEQERVDREVQALKQKIDDLKQACIEIKLKGPQIYAKPIEEKIKELERELRKLERKRLDIAKKLVCTCVFKRENRCEKCRYRQHCYRALKSLEHSKERKIREWYMRGSRGGRRKRKRE